MNPYHRRATSPEMPAAQMPRAAVTETDSTFWWTFGFILSGVVAAFAVLFLSAV